MLSAHGFCSRTREHRVQYEARCQAGCAGGVGEALDVAEEGNGEGIATGLHGRLCSRRVGEHGRHFMFMLC